MRRAKQIAAIGALLGIVVGCATCARAPMGVYRGPTPAPGAITVFDRTPNPVGEAKESKAGAPAFIVPGTTDRALRRVGTLSMRESPDSIVILVYGDNRPGFRLMTTEWGLPAVLNIGSSDARYFVWALLNIPVLAVQMIVPRLDGVQDIASLLWSHRYTGGAEKPVRRALENQIPGVDVVINTGDLVENGRRGKVWEDFVNNHRELRTRVPFLAAVGNHERTWNVVGRQNWDKAMGSPPEPEKYWYALDLPGNLGRFVFLDTNILADPQNHIPDSLEQRLATEQLDWADSALAIPAKHKFVVLHHPLVTNGHYFSDWQVDDTGPLELNRRARLLTICRKRGVTAVLAGHEHLFQRAYVKGTDGRGFWHITTGGGGSPLYRISKKDRLRALAQTLPDSSRVTLHTNEYSFYHFCRLVIRSNPANEDDRAVLQLYRVRSHGQVVPMDRIILTRPFEDIDARSRGTQ